MTKKLVKLIKPLDWIIAAMAIIMLARMDFGAVDLIDIVYLTTLVMWFIMLLVRLYMEYNKDRFRY